jgi:prepilin-type N-terminal cleavage/methylation domain-containing protein
MRHGARGYTAVEVLMGMTLFAIGAMAVISMQRASVQGNLDARKLDMANAIAHEWLERLRRDSTLWTLPSSANPTATTNYTNAKLLSGHLTYATAGNVATWSLPDDYVKSASVPDGVSPAFDILGRDLLPASYAQAQFCVNIRLNWLDPGAKELIRAEVRVVWPRLILSAPASGWCSATNANSLTGQAGTYHYLYAVTSIRQNPAQ